MKLVCARFIPTCVGNTCSAPAALSPTSVHPHVRGEHSGVIIDAGLPVRFIPTCVGNTPMRVRSHQSLTGSSPRAWGTRGAARFRL